MSKFIFLNIPVIIFFCEALFAQSFSLEVKIKHQPDNPVIIGSVRGDKFIPLDTIPVDRDNDSGLSKRLCYTFPGTFKTGMYRLVFGHTTYSRVMGEDPQQLDFIFNHENIFLETDFKMPQDSLVVLGSEENKLWFNFLSREKEYQEELTALEKEVDYFRDRQENTETPITADDIEKFKRNASESANQFNQLQMEREMFIAELISEHKDLFAVKMIEIFREPFRDGYLSSDDRRKFFQKDYFRYVDFSDLSLINSSVLTDKVFGFLVTYNQKGFTKEQREQAYIEAVKIIMKNVGQVSGEGELYSGTGIMFEFILGYLVSGFEILKMDKVLSFINDSYAGDLCNTGDNSTLVRRLKYQKMQPGTVVPDFTLEDIKGNSVTLSDILKDNTLIIFWASWCNHCNELLLKIKSWYGQSERENFAIIAISLDKSLTDWYKALVKTGFEAFYNLSDLQEWDGEVTKSYNVYATPTMFLIDSDRRIIARPVTFLELTQIFN